MTHTEEIKQIWQDAGFQEPTSIQKQTAEPIKNGDSLVMHSPTGSGKTLAYLLPLFEKMEANKQLQTLIIAPSQELVKQIENVASKWGDPLGLTSQAIIGGANIKRQIEALKDKPELIVATPGRLLELLQQSKKIKLHQVQTVIFDEADQLIENNAGQTVKEILKRLMRDTQSLWVSATYPKALADFIQANETNEVTLFESKPEASATKTDHVYIMANNRDKTEVLRQLSHIEGMRAIVFFEQIQQIEQVASKLVYRDVKVGVLHSDVSKFERETALRLFRQGELTYLLTTDVSSRGLDIPAVPYVIHYDRARELNIYVHRSGRTGRMGAEGRVISLVNEQELRDLAQKIQGEYQLELGQVYGGALLVGNQIDAEINQDSAVSKPANHTKNKAPSHKKKHKKKRHKPRQKK